MTNASGVGQALAYACAGIIYPDGLAGASVTGRRTVVRRGWLLPADLFTAQNIRNGTDFVTVTLASEDYTDILGPLGQPWRDGPRIAATVDVAEQDGGVVVSVPNGVSPTGVIGIWGVAHDPSACMAYAVQPQDTPGTIASALGGLLAGAVVNGASVAVPGVVLTARVVGYGQSSRVVRRQAQKYRVSIWTADATVREALGGALDQGMAGRNWLATLDGGQAQVRFRGGSDVDSMQNQALYRRDYLYDLTFDTLEVQWAPGMLSGGGTVMAGDALMNFGEAGSAIAQNAAVQALEAMNLAVQAQQKASAYPGLGIDAFGTVIAA